jgi:predicted AAA+ superfamily ATPase
MKNLINIKYIDELRQQIIERNGLIQVLLGPRQVGKTTSVLDLIENYYKGQAIYVSTEDYFNPNSDWLRELWQQAQSENKLLVIDEIQKLHNWSSAIKSLYDQTKRSKKNVNCVLLGSSSLEIQKGLNESLTGRFQLTRAYHWNYEESKRGYNLDFEQYLRFGGYPGSYQFIGNKNWDDYVKTSIIGTVVEKDILQFQNVKNPALFRQCFDILMSYPAQEISYTKLLGQLQERGNVEIIKHYISLYEGAYLLKAIHKLSAKPYLQKTSSPKIIPMAPCLPYLQIRTEYKPEQRGRVFEAVVGAQLLRTGEDLFYWRESDYEVDYVLKSGSRLWGIEVKSGKQKKSRSIEKFLAKFPSAKIVYINSENYYEFEKDPLQFLIKY